MSRREFTGRYRCRVANRWFRKPVMVLEVELKGLITTSIGGNIDSEWRTWWIDCQPEYLLDSDTGLLIFKD